MADLCVDLVPLFTALPQDEKIKLERLVQHQNYQKG
ncbi:MAG: Crp/Fnr family transcriptional regulator, partial [Lactobacillus crispatus]|nr:Crp/Fnr family transcriptional regulator [Lactobacillus crispatus]MCT7699674.1 Crp/Fnr family transcriptional regulator [Lactobacillus crispatus]